MTGVLADSFGQNQREQLSLYLVKENEIVKIFEKSIGIDYQNIKQLVEYGNALIGISSDGVYIDSFSDKGFEYKNNIPCGMPAFLAAVWFSFPGFPIGIFSVIPSIDTVVRVSVPLPEAMTMISHG